MDNLNLIFLSIGLGILLVALLLLILRYIKGNYKISAGIMSLILTGFIFVLIGIALMVPNLKEKVLNVAFKQEEEAVGEENASKGEASEEDIKKEEPEPDKSNGSAKKITEFNPTEHKYPTIVYESKYDNYKEYQDADGTVYKNKTMINPDGVMMGYSSVTIALVASPIENPNNDEFTYYQGYQYYKGSYHFTVSEGTFKYESKDAAAPYYKGYTPIKTEEYSGMDMQLYDFIYKFMPVQYPDQDKTAEVPLLEGEWIAYEDTIMEGSQVLVKMDFFNDGFLLMENNIVNPDEIPSNIQFKLEYLDENAYKLYLFPVNGTGNNGEFIISEEPAKRNFIVYVTSKDSFELVYYDNNLKRNSITMNRM